MKFYDLDVNITTDTIELTQSGNCGEENELIHLTHRQLLMVADEVRGITRPSAEEVESRKLRALVAELDDIVRNEDFRGELLGAHDGNWWMAKLDGLSTLAHEMAFGLEAASEPEQQPAEPITRQGGLFNAD